MLVLVCASCACKGEYFELWSTVDHSSRIIPEVPYMDKGIVFSHCHHTT